MASSAGRRLSKGDVAVDATPVKMQVVLHVWSMSQWVQMVHVVHVLQQASSGEVGVSDVQVPVVQVVPRTQVQMLPVVSNPVVLVLLVQVVQVVLVF